MGPRCRLSEQQASNSSGCIRRGSKMLVDNANNTCSGSGSEYMRVPLTIPQPEAEAETEQDNEDIEVGILRGEDDEAEDHVHLLSDEEWKDTWQRVPLGLKIALGLFGVAAFTSLRIVYSYEHLYHSWWYSTLFTVTLLATFGFSLYITGKTFWFAQVDLEHAYQELEEYQEAEHAALVTGYSAAEPEDIDEAKKANQETEDNLILLSEKPSHKSSDTNLYPHTTVLFAQIHGFHAWSSTRDPEQVFQLLEAVFSQFDELAAFSDILRIDATADAYIAVTGLPKEDPNHALNMAQFASDILRSFVATIEHLESLLGPGTGDLQMRIRMHSGPVTGGSVRGGRFQLFGDTMNKGRCFSFMEGFAGKVI